MPIRPRKWQRLTVLDQPGTTGGKVRFYRRLQRYRRLTQALAVAVLVAIPVLNLLGIHWLLGSLYSISIGELTITDPLMVLQTVLLTKSVGIGLLVAIVLPVVIALLFGRVFCSWLCPHNTIAEWLDALEWRLWRRRWVQRHRQAAPGNPPRWRIWLAFSGLLLLVVIFAFPLLTYLSSPGIISTQVARLIAGWGVGLELGLVGLVLVGEWLIGRRYWCSQLCPVGMCLGLFHTRKSLQVRHDPAACRCKSGSQPCHYICPLQLSPKSDNLYPACFNCGLCIGVCEKTGNFSLSFAFAPASPATVVRAAGKASNGAPVATTPKRDADSADSQSERG